MLKRVHVAPRVGVAILLALSLVACEDEKKSNTSSVDAGALDAGPTGPVLGGKLGQAVAAAAAARPQQTDKPDGGPPESGIFAAGGADEAHPLSAAPKLQMFAEGGDPKVPLSYSFTAGAERKATVLLQVRAAQSQLTPLTVALVFKSDKPKDDKKKTDEQDNPAELAGLPVTVKIAEVKSLRGGGVGSDLEAFKDVVLRYRLTPAGVPTDMAIEYPKKNTEAIELVTGALIESLMAMTIPLPDKPVGVGAYWMITDRAKSSGVDVVRYRVAKVVKLEDKTATLSLEVRQYAANSTFALPGLPKEIQVALDKYESQGKGEVSLGADPFLPGRGQINLVMQTLLTSPQQQGAQKLMIQTDTRAALSNSP